MATLDQVMAQPEPKQLKRKAKLSDYTDSQLGYTCKIPIADQRNVDESVVQNEIKHWLESKGAWVIKIPGSHLVGSAERFAITGLKPGAPDLLVCYKGWFIGIEVKAPKKGVRVSGNQVAQGEAIQKSGGLFIVAWKRSQVEQLIAAIDLS